MAKQTVISVHYDINYLLQYYKLFPFQVPKM